MPNPCRIRGCKRSAKDHSNMCNAHQKVQRRHGHPLQRPVSHHEMVRYRRHVRGLIDGHPKKESLWTALLEALDVMIRDAAAEVHRVSSVRGIARRSPYEVAHAITTVASEAAPEDMILTVVALGYLAAFDSHRFVDDNAYFTTIALRFRRLAPSSYNPVMSAVTGKRARVSKDFTPRSQLMLGQRLARSFAAFGVRLCELEDRQTKERMEKTKAPVALLSEDMAT